MDELGPSQCSCLDHGFGEQPSHQACHQRAEYSAGCSKKMRHAKDQHRYPADDRRAQRPIAAASDIPMALTRTGVAIPRSLLFAVSNSRKPVCRRSEIAAHGRFTALARSEIRCVMDLNLRSCAVCYGAAQLTLMICHFSVSFRKTMCA